MVEGLDEVSVGDDGWRRSMLRCPPTLKLRRAMAVDRWPMAKGKVVGGWPLLRPDTYLRRLNQTNEKKIDILNV
jgi:hypothetical protein